MTNFFRRAFGATGKIINKSVDVVEHFSCRQRDFERLEAMGPIRLNGSLTRHQSRWDQPKLV